MPDATVEPAAPVVAVEPAPNYAAVKAGLIPLTAQERIKQEKDGLDVIHDMYRYAQTGFASIEEDDFERLKWYGVYRQKPKESGYFMLRTKVPGGQLTGAQARKLSERWPTATATVSATSPRARRSRCTGCASRTCRKSSPNWPTWASRRAARAATTPATSWAARWPG